MNDRSFPGRKNVDKNGRYDNQGLISREDPTDKKTASIIFSALSLFVSCLRASNLNHPRMKLWACASKSGQFASACAELVSLPNLLMSTQLSISCGEAKAPTLGRWKLLPSSVWRNWKWEGFKTAFVSARRKEKRSCLQ